MSGFRCLALETGVRPPSVAACNGDRSFYTQLPGGTKVAPALFETIDEALDKVDLSLEGLDCIAFGCGPGAFTGLRVAAAAAQGLATGLGIGLCAVSSLAALAQDTCDQADSRAREPREGGRPALREAGDGLLPKGRLAAEGACVAAGLPAGREQVYMGWYRIEETGLVSALADDWLAVAAACRLPGNERFIAAGSAWSGNKALQAANAGRIAGLKENAVPSARAVLRLAKREYAEGRLLAPEDARPVYLRGAL